MQKNTFQYINAFSIFCLRMIRGGFIFVFLCTMTFGSYSQDTLILENKKGVQVRLDTDRFIGLYTEKPDSNLNVAIVAGR